MTGFFVNAACPHIMGCLWVWEKMSRCSKNGALSVPIDVPRCGASQQHTGDCFLWVLRCVEGDFVETHIKGSAVGGDGAAAVSADFGVGLRLAGGDSKGLKLHGGCYCSTNKRS